MVSDPSLERLECSTTRLDGDGQQLRPGFRRGGGRGPCIVFISLARRRHIVSTTVAQAIIQLIFMARYGLSKSGKILYSQEKSSTGPLLVLVVVVVRFRPPPALPPLLQA